MIAGFDQGGLGLPDRDYYLESKGNMKQVRDAYRAHVERMFALTGLGKARARAAAADVMKVETALARLAQTKVARRDPHNLYHRIERAGLRKAARTFPWDDYFTKMGIGQVTQVTVNDPAYFAGDRQAAPPPAAGRAAQLPRVDPARRRRALPHQGVRRRGLRDGEGPVGRQAAAAALAPLRPPGRPRPRRAARPPLGRGPVRRRLQGPRGLDWSTRSRTRCAPSWPACPGWTPPPPTRPETKLDKMAYLVGYPDTLADLRLPGEPHRLRRQRRSPPAGSSSTASSARSASRSTRTSGT